MDFLRKTWAEIDISALTHNFNVIKKSIGSTPVMAVVKADAYGHSADDIAPALDRLGTGAFAVSNLDEALALRTAGIKKPILILGYTPVSEALSLKQNDITQAVYSSDYAVMLNAAASLESISLDVHIKLDTGMGRIGFNCREDSLPEIDTAISCARLPNLNTTGIFTHFAVSDRTPRDDDGFTENQHARFKNAVNCFKNAGFKNLKCHCSNSAAILLDDMHYDYCRAGIILYGLTPNPELKIDQKLIPVMSFKTVVTMIKEVSEGTTVSYGRTYKAESNKRLATVAAGYADGYPRLLSNKGYVLINGKKAPITGRVCMDQFTVDISNIDDVKIGDEVLLFGKELPVEEIAKLTDTINYEIVTGISSRVPRIIKKD